MEERRIHVFDSHEAARDADRARWSSMSTEERLAEGAELHAFWVRNYFPHAARLDRTVQVAQRASQDLVDVEALEGTR